MKRVFKALIPMFLTTTMIFSNSVFSYGASRAYATVEDYVLEQEKIVEGLTYKHTVKMTTIGNIDIHTLYYKNNSENVELEVFRSEDLGKREKLSDMARNEKILAGINASFFDTSRTHSDILGYEKDNGEIFYARNNYNEKPQANALMFSEYENVFDIGYIVPKLTLTAENGTNVAVTGFNTTSSYHTASVIKGNKIKDTKYIDSKYSVYKVITDSEGVIKKVVEPKTVVTVADDEYLVTLPKASYNFLQGSLDVGDKFEFNVSTNIDTEMYDTIVSGGGTLVENGEIKLDGIIVAEKTRHPRSAIGVTKEGDIIQMVVDGRGDSLGATVKEMATFMLREGAYHAIMLDGGGSTEIVKKNDSGLIQVKNKPSDGVERKVVNGVGFKATVTFDTPTQAKYLNKDRTFVGDEVKISLVAKDMYYNNVNIDKDKLTYDVDGVEGYFNKNIFYPQSAGMAEITAYYDRIPLSRQQMLVNPMPSELFLDEMEGFVEKNSTIQFKAYVLDDDGYKTYINNNIEWSVDNPSLATISNDGKFSSLNNEGKVVVTATSQFGEIKKPLFIGNNKENVPVTSFENGEVVETGLIPDGVDGKAIITQDWSPHGANGVKLRYGFQPDIEEVQIVSAKFDGITIEKADKIKFDMSTEAMKHAVTMTIVDSNGALYEIVMANKFDEGGKRTVVADLPTDIVYPAKIKSINVVHQPIFNQTKEDVGAIYFDNIMTEIYYKVEKTQPIYPKSDKLVSTQFSSDRLSVMGSLEYLENSEQMALNSLEPKGKNSVRTYITKVSPTLKKQVTNTIVAPDWYTKAEDFYFNANMYTLKSSGRTLLKSQPDQWNMLFTDIRTTYKDNIIIMANKSPLSNGYDKLESLVFTEKLTELAEQYNKNIYFINGRGQNEVPTLTYYNNVRYIDLPSTKLTTGSTSLWSIDFYNEEGVLKYSFSK